MQKLFLTKLLFLTPRVALVNSLFIDRYPSKIATMAANHQETNVAETLLGLLGRLPETPDLKDATKGLGNVQESAVEGPMERQFVEHCISVANSMCETAMDPNLQKKKTWQALQEKVGTILQEPTEATALALSFVFGALSLFPDSEEGRKAAASAISSTTSRNSTFRHEGLGVANAVLKSFLVHSSCSTALNLGILTYFAKAFKMNHKQDPHYSDLAAKTIRFSLRGIIDEYTDQSNNGPDTSMKSNSFLPDEGEEIQKQRVSEALAFACQIGPWPMLSPVVLVEAAIPFEYWHASELLCACAYKAAKTTSSTSGDIVYDKGQMLTEATRAVESLVDAAMEARLFRLADNMATKLYEEGGKSRYVEARLYHAYDTISKVIYKRQLPIIERQVDRVDKSVDKVKNDLLKAQEELPDQASVLMTAESDIRRFALDKLSEAGEISAAHRLATNWSMEYVYDERTMLEAAAARRKRYLQWDDCMHGSIPGLISDPETLISAFELIQNDHIFGMDAEWDEDTKGAELFQLAGQKHVLLIDIPSLSSTEGGVKALSKTVGELLNSPKVVVVGFAPRQDLSRLRASPCCSDEHWLSGSRAVVDAQRLAGDVQSKLKNLGLSRASQHYLGKPLDKAEQCSIWSARPLSDNQRAYAALDAWVCVAIYEKLFPAGRSKS
eukprot:scaffold1736_cov127-Cylindrotheca_fusiformis.AAC.15